MMAWYHACNPSNRQKLILLGDVVILVIFLFGFEDGTLVLIASVPGHCLSLTF